MIDKPELMLHVRSLEEPQYHHTLRTRNNAPLSCQQLIKSPQQAFSERGMSCNIASQLFFDNEISHPHTFHCAEQVCSKPSIHPQKYAFAVLEFMIHTTMHRTSDLSLKRQIGESGPRVYSDIISQMHVFSQIQSVVVVLCGQKMKLAL